MGSLWLRFRAAGCFEYLVGFRPTHTDQLIEEFGSLIREFVEKEFLNLLPMSCLGSEVAIQEFADGDLAVDRHLEERRHAQVYLSPLGQ